MTTSWRSGFLVDEETGEVLERDRRPAAKLLAASWYRDALERSGKVKAGTLGEKPMASVSKRRRGAQESLF